MMTGVSRPSPWRHAGLQLANLLHRHLLAVARSAAHGPEQPDAASDRAAVLLRACGTSSFERAGPPSSVQTRLATGRLPPLD